MTKFIYYANFIKLEHTLFSLPLILAGSLLAAQGIPDLKLLILILVAGAGARTSALAINRILDRRIDSLNPRTKQRELPAGRVSLLSACLITVLGLLAYFLAAYLICDLTLYLSPIPILVFIIYPLMKRFTYLCHFGVGLGLGLAPLGGWIAVTCSLSDLLPAIILFLFTLCWVSGFDIIYATLDEEFDRKSNVYSMVSIYGKEAALSVSSVLHHAAFLAVVFLYFYQFRSIVSAALLIAIGVLLYLEHKKAQNVDLAFFKINVLVGVTVFLFVLSGIYLP